MDPYILVVDDFEDGRDMLKEYLEFRGFSVVTANDGAEAVAIAKDRPPAIILMDLTMPGLDGWAATRRLRGDIRTEQCIVIAVTANALAHDDARALAAGCDAFLAKPFDLATLADALAQVLAHGRAALKSVIVGQPSQPQPPTRRRRAVAT